MQRAETLVLSNGRLGPLRPFELPVAPLTLLIGRQGTGKSLVAQMLYFFRALPMLAAWERAVGGRDEAKAPEVIRRVLNGLRSSERSFARMTDPNATLTWSGDLGVSPGDPPRSMTLGFNSQFATSAIQPQASLRRLVEESLKPVSHPQGANGIGYSFPLSAIYLPAERIIHSVGLGETAFSFLQLPLVFRAFLYWTEFAGKRQEDWVKGRADTPDGRWVQQHLKSPLAGEVIRREDSWRWKFSDQGKSRSIELDMASSGQRAGFHVGLWAQVLFSLRAGTGLVQPFTLFVEEPEIHLHPDAQRAVTEVVAFLVNKGIRVVLTTHSLTVLYALNNLMLASRLPASASDDRLPPKEARIDAGSVAAYHVADGRVESIVDRERGEMDESRLGHVSDALGAQMNRIYSLLSKSRS